MKPPFPTPDDLVTAILALSESDSGTVGHQDAFWAHLYLDELVEQYPAIALDIIIEVLKRSDSPRVVEYLSAGPIEDILKQHGDHMIGRFLQEAADNSRFRHALGGVWQTDIKQQIWDKIQAIRDLSRWTD